MTARPVPEMGQRLGRRPRRLVGALGGQGIVDVRHGDDAPGEGNGLPAQARRDSRVPSQRSWWVAAISAASRTRRRVAAFEDATAALGMRLHRPALVRGQAPGFSRIASGTLILPTSCMVEARLSCSTSLRGKAQALGDPGDVFGDPRHVVAGLRVAMLGRLHQHLMISRSRASMRAVAALTSRSSQAARSLCARRAWLRASRFETRARTSTGSKGLARKSVAPAASASRRRRAGPGSSP